MTTIGGFPWRCYDDTCETHAECLMYGCKLVKAKEVDASKAARPFDFSKPETQALYEAEVRKRVELFGMSREQAEMLVAILMTPLAPGSASLIPAPRQHVSDGVDRFTIPNSGEKK